MKTIKKLFLSAVIISFSACEKEEEMMLEIYNLKPVIILQLVNEQRSSGCRCGNTDMPPVPVLKWDHSLASTAYKHSLDMQTRKYFSHQTPEGLSPGDRLKAAGYNYASFGENIAVGHPDEAAVIRAWLKSEGHCRNIMGKNFTAIGVGQEKSYWTMLLARPAQ